MKAFQFLFFIFFLAIKAPAQETVTPEKEDLKGSHRLSLGLGHTHVAESMVDGKKEWRAFASWSLKYDLWLSNKWAIGLENDMILESFMIENAENKTIERSYPVSIVPEVLFKPLKHLGLVGGTGVEISSEENMVITRFGVEASFQLPNWFELSAGLIFDERWDNYNSFALTLTVSKIFSKHRQHY
jgi:hypothetical protein